LVKNPHFRNIANDTTLQALKLSNEAIIGRAIKNGIDLAKRKRDSFNGLEITNHKYINKIKNENCLGIAPRAIKKTRNNDKKYTTFIALMFFFIN